MCTAISYKTKFHYFGRNLDLDYRYHETVTITPRKFPLQYRMQGTQTEHYAMIGMASVMSNYPLYYEATNEYGLSMAGLNFPGNATYLSPKDSCVNIAPFELIPWILSQCKTVSQAKNALSDINLVDIPFSDTVPLTPIHWMLSDKNASIVIEPMERGVVIYDDPVGVLTNNPPFDYHMHNLTNFLNLTQEEPSNRFSDQIDLKPYSRGMGAIGLPGDLSSASRFIKAAFTKLNSVTDETESASVCQFFHILSAVAQQNGCVKVGSGFEKTIYSSCCNTDSVIYYYTTYENSQITGIHLFHEDLDKDQLFLYPLNTKQNIRFEN